MEPSKEVPVVTERYLQNALDGFPNGCMLDLRVRLAVDFIRNSTLFTGATLTNPEKDVAAYALNLSTALLELAKERGLIEPLPAGPELDEHLKVHADRNARFQVESNLAGQRYAQNLTSGLAVPRAPGFKAN